MTNLRAFWLATTTTKKKNLCRDSRASNVCYLVPVEGEDGVSHPACVSEQKVDFLLELFLGV